MSTLRIELTDTTYTEGGRTDDGLWGLFIGEKIGVEGTNEVELVGTPEQFELLTSSVAATLYKLKDIVRGN